MVNVKDIQVRSTRTRLEIVDEDSQYRDCPITGHLVVTVSQILNLSDDPDIEARTQQIVDEVLTSPETGWLKLAHLYFEANGRGTIHDWVYAVHPHDPYPGAHYLKDGVGNYWYVQPALQIEHLGSDCIPSQELEYQPVPPDYPKRDIEVARFMLSVSDAVLSYIEATSGF